MTSASALRIARWGEVAYALIAVVLAFGLPWPPQGTGMVLFAHWLGTALLAAAIAVRLGRPNRQTWYIASLLSAYVLINALVAIVRLAGPTADALGRPSILALAVGALLWITQAVVAVSLYHARELRTMSTSAARRR